MGHINITRININGGGFPMMHRCGMHFGGIMPPIFMAPPPPVTYMAAGAAIGGAAAAGAFNGLFNLIGKGFSFVNQHVFKPIYQHVIKPVWNNYIKPVWNGVGNLIKYGWDHSFGKLFKWMGNLGKKKTDKSE